MWKHNLPYGNETRTAQNISASINNFLYNGWSIATAGSSISNMGILIMINFIKFAKGGNCKNIQAEEQSVPRSPCITEAEYNNYFWSESCQDCNMKNVRWIIRKHCLCSLYGSLKFLKISAALIVNIIFSYKIVLVRGANGFI